MVSVTAQTLPHLMTAEEFERIADAPENAERRLELIYGEIVEKIPTEEHAVVAAAITAFLFNYCREHKLGRVGVDPRHRMPEDEHNARLPDVAYTSPERLLPLVEEGSVPQMPDLAVEIKSPCDHPRDMRQKAHYYLTHGAKLVWLVYPPTRTAEVCRLNAVGELAIEVVPENGALSGGEVLPDFSLALKDIFPQK